MSAKKFIAELERRQLLSDRLMARLRDFLAESERPLSADALARFLVEKRRLSDQQAREVLNGLSQSGVNLDEQDAGDEEEAGGSSIFSPHPTAIGKRSAEPNVESEEDDEIRLAPIEEDFATPQKSRFTEEDDLPLSDTIPEVEEPLPLRPAPSPESKLLRDVTEPKKSNVESELDADLGPTTQTATAAKRKSSLGGGKKRDKKKAKRSKEKKRWDSPLILVGGGSLTLLLLVGATIWWLLGRESGDQKLAQADAALKSGAYAQAIEQYEEFLKNFPRHAEHSLAHVQLAMVRIRQPTEAGDFAAALTAAESELKAVEDEDAFNDAHGELAALLPRIALGLADAAEKANPTSEDAKKFVELANQSIALCNNAAYVPKSLRDEAKLANVQDTLDRVARRQQSQRALSEGLSAIEQAIAAGKPVAGYAAHRKLLTEHPELAGDTNLAAAIRKTTAAEQAAIRFVKQEKAAETTERPTAWRAALAVANRRVKPAAAPAGVTGAVCIHIDGAVYAVDAASGRLLWRRHVGFGATAPPFLIDRDVIIADAIRNELLRLDAATGALIWRQTIGEPFVEPLNTGAAVLVPTKLGRLYAIDLKTGASSGYLQFAQPLPVSPTIDRQKLRIFVAGEQGSLYSISLIDMKCIGVNYLGHSPGSIRVPAAAVTDKVAIIENDGVETSRLHLMSLDDKGAIGKQVADRRLNGLAASPPIVTGRGMIIVTDRGQIEVYDIATGSGANALTLVATREATGSQPLVRHIAVVGRNVWVADTQLTKYNILPTDNRLPIEEIENNFKGATFDHPLTVFGDTLIHVRRPKDRAGFIVAASDTKQGHPLWETDLAIPPAGVPVVDESAKTLAIASAEGYVFRFDEAAIRFRVQDEPVASQLMPAELPALTAAVDLGQGRAAFCAPKASQLLLYNPAPAGATWLPLESPLACAVTPLGQGFLAPLKIGQVFYLSSANGARLATPFQPRLEPDTTLEYKPAAAVGNDGRQFVIADGRQKIYLVALADKPQPHLEEVKHADVGPNPIESPVVVVGDMALAVAGGNHVVRFHLPKLEATADVILPAPLEWGPYRVGDLVLVATADDKLLALSAAGEVKWNVPIKYGALAGAPLALADGVVLAYRKGVVERRSMADGKPLGAANLEQPLATGPVAFLQRLVVAAGDGTLLVVDPP